MSRRKPRKSRGRQKSPTSTAKNGYYVPIGQYVSIGDPHVMSNGRVIRIRAVHRANPDLKELARIFVELAEQHAKQARDPDDDVHKAA